MDRRCFLALATTTLLAGCPSDEETPSPTNGTNETVGPTTTGSPAGPATTTGASTETERATETSTETPTETETPTARPNPQAAEELDDARARLNRAVENYAAESHRFRPDSILETTADSEGFVPGRVTGAIEDARKSLSRAGERATPAQQEAIDRLREFGDWLEQAVGVQARLVAAAVHCRNALEGSVPSDDGEIRSEFQELAEDAEAARDEAESLSAPSGDVSDEIEALDDGTVAEKMDQFRTEATTLVTFAGYGESIVAGIDMLIESRGEPYIDAIPLAQDAIAEFESVETDADGLEVPESLSDERADFVVHAADWRDHAEDRLETYRDAQSD